MKMFVSILLICLQYGTNLLLKYFFDHHGADDNASFFLFTVSPMINNRTYNYIRDHESSLTVILDFNCDYNCRSCYTNKKRVQKATPKVVAPPIDTSSLTPVTKVDINTSHVPVQASDDDVTPGLYPGANESCNNPTDNYLIHTWSINFLTKQLKNKDKYESKFNFHICQAKQNAVDNYLSINELLTSNTGMGTHFQVIATRHIKTIFNQSKVDAQQLLK